MDRTELNARLEFRRAALNELRTAYLALVNGQVASYTIGSRNLICAQTLLCCLL